MLIRLRILEWAIMDIQVFTSTGALAGAGPRFATWFMHAKVPRIQRSMLKNGSKNKEKRWGEHFWLRLSKR